jgi:hypothetical protein
MLHPHIYELVEAAKRAGLCTSMVRARACQTPACLPSVCARSTQQAAGARAANYPALPNRAARSPTAAASTPRRCCACARRWTSWRFRGMPATTPCTWRWGGAWAGGAPAAYQTRTGLVRRAREPRRVVPLVARDNSTQPAGATQPNRPRATRKSRAVGGRVPGHLAHVRCGAPRASLGSASRSTPWSRNSTCELGKPCSGLYLAARFHPSMRACSHSGWMRRLMRRKHSPSAALANTRMAGTVEWPSAHPPCRGNNTQTPKDRRRGPLILELLPDRRKVGGTTRLRLRPRESRSCLPALLCCLSGAATMHSA